ncbi:hypothetical protein NPIL_116691 [Nephila pilipes]|uniref:Uncharacterized protein n=1 Tax=Nephila pilipes TaxID=299642 RepID=A0A8X6IUG8_NEPPI|nr:hypothetical protein NPIL_116691 [Nephila pilipes]
MNGLFYLWLSGSICLCIVFGRGLFILNLAIVYFTLREKPFSGYYSLVAIVKMSSCHRTLSSIADAC